MDIQHTEKPNKQLDLYANYLARNIDETSRNA